MKNLGQFIEFTRKLQVDWAYLYRKLSPKPLNGHPHTSDWGYPIPSNVGSCSTLSPKKSVVSSAQPEKATNRRKLQKILVPLQFWALHLWFYALFCIKMVSYSKICPFLSPKIVEKIPKIILLKFLKNQNFKKFYTFK